MRKALSLLAFVVSNSLYAGSYDLTCTGEGPKGEKLTFTRENFSLLVNPTKTITLTTVEESYASEGGIFLFTGPRTKAKITLTKLIAEIDSWETNNDCGEGIGYGPGEYGSTQKFLSTLQINKEKAISLELTCVEHGGYSGNCEFDERDIDL